MWKRRAKQTGQSQGTQHAQKVIHEYSMLYIAYIVSLCRKYLETQYSPFWIPLKNGTPKDDNDLIPGTWDHCAIQQSKFYCKEARELETWVPSWVLWPDPQHSHRHPLSRQGDVRPCEYGGNSCLDQSLWLLELGWRGIIPFEPQLVIAVTGHFIQT